MGAILVLALVVVVVRGRITGIDDKPRMFTAVRHGAVAVNTMEIKVVRLGVDIVTAAQGMTKFAEDSVGTICQVV